MAWQSLLDHRYDYRKAMANCRFYLQMFDDGKIDVLNDLQHNKLTITRVMTNSHACTHHSNLGRGEEERIQSYCKSLTPGESLKMRYLLGVVLQSPVNRDNG